MFKPLPDKLSYPEIEHEILKFWKENGIFEKSLEQRKDSQYYSFYEGPPTVNGNPGVHHVMARTIKDTICRYKTMNGYFVRRQAGWDTHGLPVEIELEKRLGLKDKSDIEKYGIEKFNAACKEFVYSNIEKDQGWGYLTERMGYWVDLKDAYITCTNNYIESVWWALKTYFDKGLIYRGFKVVPQSPTIETPLSSHELSLGYKDVRDPNCYIKLKITSSPIKAIENARLLVWTTTPWTLLANVALAAGVDIDYVHVRNTRKQKEDVLIDELVLAKARLSALDGEYEILNEFKGSELIGTRYEQIFSYYKIDFEQFPDALSVLPGDFVSTEDGSGIVHLAPAFGEDDYQMSRKYKIPFAQPVTPNGHFTDDMGEFAGRAIKTFTYKDHTEEGSDKDIVVALKYADKIYRSTNDYLHSYPHCWRTGNPIMYYARESWFIKSPEYKQNMIDRNKEINWQPAEIGAGRFGNWLEEVKEWSLSRDRFWGTPLPIWVNENDKSDYFAIGSIEELSQGIYVFEDGRKVPVKNCGIEVDLHRPFVDNVIFEKNGNSYKRVHEVIDVWFDSGAMPFAQLHYPFENKELFDKIFPGDFIAEGIDQTRGWFYTLHNIAVALFDKPAYKNIVVNELILDKNGVKMSKRLGNTIDPFELMEKYGADAVRWYLFVNNPPWKTTKFNQEDIARTVISDFLRSLTNTYAFFALYANIDGFTGNEPEIPVSERPEIDRWIISRVNTLVKEYRNLMEDYEMTKAPRAVQDFAIYELSNWYIRRNRRRFWKGEKDDEKIAAYQTLREVLVKVLQLMAPQAPFISEDLYQRLRNDNDALSIHLTDMPVADESLIDTELERRMDAAQKITSLARSLREKANLKVRQPLRRILVPVNNPTERRDIQQVEDIIIEEINVKAIEFITDNDSDIVRKVAKPNFKIIGKKYGKSTQGVANFIKSMTNEMIKSIEKAGVLTTTIDGNDLEISFEDIEIQSEDIEGWLVATENGITVALDTSLDDGLINEGIAREFVNRIQNLRKDSGFEVTDRIKIQYVAGEKISSSIELMTDYIKNETLADSLEFCESPENAHEVELIEETVTIALIKM
ncbi:MAG: isoleucine--tRNA ligase [Candidatus Kapabacteria bacterium]|nr:isoleucine--tRNA ligase [Ignavibacteriota bacterium]MCW5885623.1 isoleucine--tRNA ligase [Candidatus Kapabacteria bacterium]